MEIKRSFIKLSTSAKQDQTACQLFLTDFSNFTVKALSNEIFLK